MKSTGLAIGPSAPAGDGAARGRSTGRIRLVMCPTAAQWDLLARTCREDAARVAASGRTASVRPMRPAT